MKMRVTAINLKDSKTTKNERIKRAEELILNSGASDLYLLPELWNTGFFNTHDYDKNKEPIDGITVTKMRETAKKRRAYIFMGSFIEERENNLYNTAVLIDRRGDIVSSYSKIHLFGEEKKYLKAGEKIQVCDTEFGKAGLSICYDMRFPELYRKMSDMGAQIFLVCAAWPEARKEHWDIFNRVRGLENQAILLSCCSSGDKYSGTSYGVMPDGRIISISDKETVSFEADTAKTEEYRSAFGALRDRRIF